VYPKGINSMAVSGLGSRKALVGTRRAISVLFGINGLRNELSPLGWSIQGPFCQLARLTSSKSLGRKFVKWWVWLQSRI